MIVPRAGQSSTPFHGRIAAGRPDGLVALGLARERLEQALEARDLVGQRRHLAPPRGRGALLAREQRLALDLAATPRAPPPAGLARRAGRSRALSACSRARSRPGGAPRRTRYWPSRRSVAPREAVEPLDRVEERRQVAAPRGARGSIRSARSAAAAALARAAAAAVTRPRTPPPPRAPASPRRAGARSLRAWPRRSSPSRVAISSFSSRRCSSSASVASFFSLSASRALSDPIRPWSRARSAWPVRRRVWLPGRRAARPETRKTRRRGKVARGPLTRAISPPRRRRADRRPAPAPTPSRPRCRARGSAWKGFDEKKTPRTRSGSSEQWSPLQTSRLSSKTLSGRHAERGLPRDAVARPVRDDQVGDQARIEAPVDVLALEDARDRPLAVLRIGQRRQPRDQLARAAPRTPRRARRSPSASRPRRLT